MSTELLLHTFYFHLLVVVKFPLQGESIATRAAHVLPSEQKEWYDDSENVE
jgi:hypothetical protein